MSEINQQQGKDVLQEGSSWRHVADEEPRPLDQHKEHREGAADLASNSISHWDLGSLRILPGRDQRHILSDLLSWHWWPPLLTPVGDTAALSEQALPGSVPSLSYPGQEGEEQPG